MREVQDFIAKVDIEGGRSMTEGPYKLPEGWRWVRLGEVCEVLQGKTPPKSAYVNRPTAIKVLKFRDITPEGHIVWDNTERGFLERDENWRYAKIGDVLVTASAHSPDQIGRKVALLDFIPSEYSRIAVTAELMVLRPLTISLDSLWLKYWLASADGYQQLQMQVKEKHLVQSRAINILLPLPPLEEQKRIVARIEELMGRVREARRLREEAKQEAERLWQAVLAQTFPKPKTELPKGWRWVRLGEVAKVYAGSPAPQGEQYFREGEWPFVRVQDLGHYGQTTCLKETADYVNEYALQKYRLRLAKAGTILFPKSGAAILTNSRAILGVDAYIVSHLAAVEPLPDRLDTYWAYFWLCTVDMKEFIDNPSYPSLRLSEISKLPIPLPPLEEQRHIVEHLQDVQGKIKALKEAQAQTDAELKRLEQAILDKAFRGEL